MREVLDNYGWIRNIEQAITDRGSQFYANKKDNNNESESQFDVLFVKFICYVTPYAIGL